MKACRLVLLLAVACGAGCRQDMYNQPKVKPLAASPLFSDGAAARPLVPGTIPRDWHGRALLERGRERFDIYCAVCHDRAGTGQGMIVQRGFPPPPSFHLDRLRAAPIGHFYDVITHGYGAMYPYAARVEPADRWAIAAYLRALQLSQDARPEDVPAGELAKLEPAS
jgi:mono/diheme cytochrome c family protein